MLVQKELKNWYIWEYVEPRTYSYDFTTWSVADFNNEWWSWTSWCTMDSSWLYKNWWATIQRISFSDLATALSSSNRVVMKLVYEKTWTWEWDYWFTLINNTSEITNIYWNYNLVTFSIVPNSYLNNNYTISQWTYTITADVDLANKTASFKDSPLWIDSLYTITDWDVTAVKSCNGLQVVVNRYMKAKSIGVTIY